jgi:hypothetical protein
MNPPTPTAVERVRAEREAFVRGARWREVGTGWDLAPMPYATDAMIREASERHFPMPLVDVPRVVVVGDWSYRVIGDVIQCRHRSARDSDWAASGYSRHAITAIADLLATPTRTVPADSPEAVDAAA